MKASTKKTPQPSPASHSAVQEAQGQCGQQSVGTGPRLSALRRECLIRDRHRCVVSRAFDQAEAFKRRNDPDGLRDDEGNLLENGSTKLEALEVAHILPHSFNKGFELVCIFPSKQSPPSLNLCFRITLKTLHLRF